MTRTLPQLLLQTRPILYNIYIYNIYIIYILYIYYIYIIYIYGTLQIHAPCQQFVFHQVNLWTLHRVEFVFL